MKVKDLLTPMAWLEMLPRKFLRGKKTASARVGIYTYFNKPFLKLPSSFSSLVVKFIAVLDNLRSRSTDESNLHDRFTGIDKRSRNRSKRAVT
jgi:hypothetical protein